MFVALVGKPNSGKSTFFSAAAMIDVEISNRIFTTIEPNKGVTYVRSACPCRALNIECTPQNSKCVDGVRYVPVKIIDVAGLVPDAHKGRGLGNQFLSDIMEADALIHVVDISGSTNSEGQIVEKGTHDPKEDIKFLEEEIDYWITGILKKNLHTLSRRVEATKEKFSDVVYKQLAGLGIKLTDVEEAMTKIIITSQSLDDDLLEFVKILREKSKPIIIAANKIDSATSPAIFERIRDVTGIDIIPCSAESELALRKASDKGIIRYMSGDSNFKVVKELDQKQTAALNFIKDCVLKPYGSTGVQRCIDRAVFEILGMIVVYPVENEHKFSDKKGNILPHALLMKKGSTTLDMAFKVHEDIGKKFISAVDAKTGKHISANYELKNGDVISIKAGR